MLVLTSKRTQGVCFTKIDWSLPVRKIMAGCCEHRANPELQFVSIVQNNCILKRVVHAVAVMLLRCSMIASCLREKRSVFVSLGLSFFRLLSLSVLRNAVNVGIPLVVGSVNGSVNMIEHVSR